MRRTAAAIAVAAIVVAVAGIVAVVRSDGSTSRHRRAGYGGPVAVRVSGARVDGAPGFWLDGDSVSIVTARGIRRLHRDPVALGAVSFPGLYRHLKTVAPATSGRQVALTRNRAYVADRAGGLTALELDQAGGVRVVGHLQLPGRGAARLATDGATVWVRFAEHTAPVAGPRQPVLIKVDATRFAVVRSSLLPGPRDAPIAVVNGTPWVAGADVVPPPAGLTSVFVQAYDPATLRAGRRVDGVLAHHLAASGGELWAVGPSLHRIDTGAGREVGQPVRIAASPTAFAVSGEDVWVVGGGHVTLFRARRADDGVQLPDVEDAAPPLGPGMVFGRAYAAQLSTHCGIATATFDGRWWDLLEGDPARPPGFADPSQPGSVVLDHAGSLRFLAASRVVRYVPRPLTAPPPPACY